MSEDLERAISFDDAHNKSYELTKKYHEDIYNIWREWNNGSEGRIYETSIHFASFEMFLSGVIERGNFCEQSLFDAIDSLKNDVKERIEKCRLEANKSK